MSERRFRRGWRIIATTHKQTLPHTYTRSLTALREELLTPKGLETGANAEADATRMAERARENFIYSGGFIALDREGWSTYAS